ncbi:YbhB/YbcL family Raf kinase inhibitor-like protein [Lactococcus piscium]|uniref:Phosphatidylethanolamine-binding protein n=1 Tax=Pseudolactococcus paracarnosus TaxID=2749962 RepID=A0A7L4WE53_9LACT|nr:YbhB/YbcL family Raf kinase inhibitor-like protein [Lactococcus paracarnosus]MCJ1993499.1 YbhB/YbcL family Raf kinase inhibitor-like protein [Lactococcus paracarnosus]QDJ27821.1 phosphatidylethanolamine-binding protein [Lactococcus paracarnosus]SPC35925.1 conserved hypothetical protein [Lactococcus piscium]
MNIKVITDNMYIPKKFSKYADDADKYKGQPIVSFPFAVKGLPSGTKFLAFSLLDHDAVPVCGFSWIHWLVANVKVSGDEIEIPENFSKTSSAIVQGTNSFDSIFVGETDTQITQRYVGPTPPDKAHRYTLTVFALSDKLGLQEGFYFNAFRDAMHDKIIDEVAIDLWAES